MYLITVEGGDGSGKGVATKILAEICEDFSFTDVVITAEPRRDHPLGQLAVEAVRTGEAGPIREASMFAADRLDHSHAWIIPKLNEGQIVISERNVHSSLVYQGIVGDLGLEEVARLNSAACVPDLCIWVDCDPEMALNRISEDGLKLDISTRDTNQVEYFETDEYQEKIRAGYSKLLGGEVAMPAPFDKGEVVGPIVNDGTKMELKAKLKAVFSAFLHRKEVPLNVNSEEVDRNLIASALKWQCGQQRLDVLDSPPTRFNDDWLGGEAPWRVIKHAQELYDEGLEAHDHEREGDVPQSPLHHTVLSVVGTLSLLPGAEVASLRCWLGPVRPVTSRHTQRMLKFLNEQSGWVRVHKSFKGKDARRFELRSDWQAYGRLGLAIWPIKEELSAWRLDNPEGRWRNSLSAILGKNPNTEMRGKVDACIKRLGVLGSGAGEGISPEDLEQFRRWWREGP